jgi:hypothetical protein
MWTPGHGQRGLLERSDTPMISGFLYIMRKFNEVHTYTTKLDLQTNTTYPINYH